MSSQVFLANCLLWYCAQNLRGRAPRQHAVRWAAWDVSGGHIACRHTLQWINKPINSIWCLHVRTLVMFVTRGCHWPHPLLVTLRGFSLILVLHFSLCTGKVNELYFVLVYILCVSCNNGFSCNEGAAAITLISQYGSAKLNKCLACILFFIEISFIFTLICHNASLFII